MRVSILLAMLAGLFITVWFVFHFGVRSTWGTITAVGWRGFSLLCLYGLANFILLGLAWFALEPTYRPTRAAVFVWGRAVRDSAGEILPFSQLGGLVLGARAIELCGVDRPTAVASTIIDMTLEMIAQIAFILCGLLVLVIYFPTAAFDTPMMRTILAGSILAIMFVCGFFVLQQRAFSFFERISRRLMPSASEIMNSLNLALARIHANPRRMFACFFLHAGGWMSGAFGTWLALDLIGKSTPFADTLILEAILCAVRSAVVVIPGAIGVQEATYTVLMPLFGLPLQTGIAISLLKRAREFAVGIPILSSWQVTETVHANSIINR